MAIAEVTTRFLSSLLGFLRLLLSCLSLPGLSSLPRWCFRNVVGRRVRVLVTAGGVAGVVSSGGGGGGGGGGCWLFPVWSRSPGSLGEIIDPKLCQVSQPPLVKLDSFVLQQQQGMLEMTCPPLPHLVYVQV